MKSNRKRVVSHVGDMGVDERYEEFEQYLSPVSNELSDTLESDYIHDHFRTDTMRKLADLHDRIVEGELRPVRSGEHSITVALDLERTDDSATNTIVLVPYAASIEHFVRCSSAAWSSEAKVNLPLTLEDLARRPDQDARDSFVFDGVDVGDYLIILQCVSGGDWLTETIGIRRVTVDRDIHVWFKEEDLFVEGCGVSVEESVQPNRCRHYEEG